MTKFFRLRLPPAFFLGLCLYYVANLLLRWLRLELHSGGGAYGWPKPDTAVLWGLHLALLSMAILLFLLLPLVALRVGRKFSDRMQPLAWALAIVLVGLVVGSELDYAWYAIGHKHIRINDIAIFLTSNTTEHFGISPSEIARMAALVVIHIVAGVGLAIASIKLDAKFPVASDRLVRYGVVLAMVVVAGGCIANFHLTGRRMDQWIAIEQKAWLHPGMARFVDNGHPDAGMLNRRLAQALATPPALASEPLQVAPTTQAPKHVLVVLIEGWNREYFSEEVMPHLWQLSKKLQRHPLHFSTGNNTLLGVTGTAYAQSPAFFFEGSAPAGTVSPGLEAMGAAGISLRRFGAGLTSYRNIESYLGQLSTGDQGENSKASDSVAAVLRHMQEKERSFSLYYYGQTHFPYNHSPEFQRFKPEASEATIWSASLGPNDRQAVVNRYKNVLNEADTQLAPLWRDIDWATTAVIISGDHGESMMEHGRLSHSSSLETSQVATPLLLHVPGATARVGEAQVTSHLDLLPTVLDALQLAMPVSLQGQSLLREAGRRRALVMHNNQNARPTLAAVVAPSHKLIVDLENLGKPEVVDLLGLDDTKLSASQIDARELDDSISYLAQTLYRAGCLGQAMRAPLRHCAR